jgi:hypothetical protein
LNPETVTNLALVNLFQHGEHGDTEITEKINLETAFDTEIAEAQRTQRKPGKVFLPFSAISASLRPLR